MKNFLFLGLFLASTCLKGMTEGEDSEPWQARAELNAAILTGSIEMAEQALTLGARPDGISDESSQDTYMHEAARQGSIVIMEWLMLHGARINELNRGGLSPLDVALKRGDFTTALWLISHGASFERRSIRDAVGPSEFEDHYKYHFHSKLDKDCESVKETVFSRDRFDREHLNGDHFQSIFHAILTTKHKSLFERIMSLIEKARQWGYNPFFMGYHNAEPGNVNQPKSNFLAKALEITAALNNLEMFSSIYREQQVSLGFDAQQFAHFLSENIDGPDVREYARSLWIHDETLFISALQNALHWAATRANEAIVKLIVESAIMQGHATSLSLKKTIDLIESNIRSERLTQHELEVFERIKNYLERAAEVQEDARRSLTEAVRSGDSKAVQDAIARGAPLDRSNPDLIVLAAQSRSKDIVMYLATQGFSIIEVFRYAVKTNDQSLLEWLIENGLNAYVYTTRFVEEVRENNLEMRNALCRANMWGHIFYPSNHTTTSDIEVALSNGYSIHSPLFWLEPRNRSVVQWLIEHGATIPGDCHWLNIEEIFSEPLLRSILLNESEAITLLETIIERPKVRFQDYSLIEKALMLAAAQGTARFVNRILASFSRYFHSRQYTLGGALNLAALSGNNHTFRALFEYLLATIRHNRSDWSFLGITLLNAGIQGSLDIAPDREEGYLDIVHFLLEMDFVNELRIPFDGAIYRLGMLIDQAQEEKLRKKLQKLYTILLNRQSARDLIGRVMQNLALDPTSELSRLPTALTSRLLNYIPGSTKPH